MLLFYRCETHVFHPPLPIAKHPTPSLSTAAHSTGPLSGLSVLHPREPDDRRHGRAEEPNAVCVSVIHKPHFLDPGCPGSAWVVGGWPSKTTVAFPTHCISVSCSSCISAFLSLCVCVHFFLAWLHSGTLPHKPHCPSFIWYKFIIGFQRGLKLDVSNLEPPPRQSRGRLGMDAG